MKQLGLLKNTAIVSEAVQSLDNMANVQTVWTPIKTIRCNIVEKVGDRLFYNGQVFERQDALMICRESPSFLLTKNHLITWIDKFGQTKNYTIQGIQQNQYKASNKRLLISLKIEKRDIE